MLFRLSLLLLVAAVVPVATGQTVLYTVAGDAPGDLAGSAVAQAGDVDGDGRPDFVLGCPGAPAGASAGRVKVVSGATGAVIFVFNGSAPGDQLGSSVDGAGDVDGDGRADIIAGAPFADANGIDAGQVRVYSGQTGAILFTFAGDSAFDHLGAAVSAAGDVNGDGFADVALGAFADDFNGFESGSVWIRSGATGAILRVYRGDGAGDHFGFALDRAGDVNGDLVPDLVVGAPLDDNAGPSSGSVRVLSGATGLALFTVNGIQQDEQLGFSVAGAGNVNADAWADVIAGGPYGGSGGFWSGRVAVLAGPAGAAVTGLSWSGTAQQDYLGWSVGSAGDVNGDGRSDPLFGNRTEATSPAAGTVQIRSGQGGGSAYAFTGASAGESFGQAVAGAGDLDGDGRLEILVGAPHADPAGTSSGIVRAVTLLPLAATASVGVGCAGGAAPPVLGTSIPRLGQPFGITIALAPAFTTTVVLVSLPPATPTSLGSGCTAYVDPVTMSLLATIATGSSGFGNITLSLPNIPAWAGSQVVLQGAIAAAASPIGWTLTNGRLLTLGY